MVKRITDFYILYALVTVCLTVAMYHWAYARGLHNAQTDSIVRLEQAAGRLTGQMYTYRVLVNAIAKDPRVIGALQSPVLAQGVSETLRNQALTYGVNRIDLITANRLRIGSADPQARATVKPDSTLIRAALNGRLGQDYIIDLQGNRFVRFARGVSGPGEGKAGAVILWVNLAELEFEWPVVPETIFFASDDRVIAASRWDIVDQKPLQLGPTSDTITLSHAVPQIGLTALGRFSIVPVHNFARLQAILVFLATVILGLALFVWHQQQSRLHDKAAVNAMLEARVADRTRALRAAQDTLIQTSKLTALGQMSAGISHELNQPLAAILTYA
ncbi:MAG: hypothetical protein AAF701_10025, partial [Pseudomonadota bacterium]